MTRAHLEDMALVGDLTANSLRRIWHRLDDERLKRLVLTMLGWKLCRRRGAWVAQGELEKRIQPDLTLEGTLILIVEYLWDDLQRQTPPPAVNS